jgi:hypothetical protein
MDSKAFLSQLQVHLQLGNKLSCEHTCKWGKKGPMGLAWILKHLFLSCKSTCNWATNLVATTLAKCGKNGKMV